LLGAEQFSEAWERGHELRGEQAVAAAIEVAVALAGNPEVISSDLLHGSSNGSATKAD
jgi:hypothetical protein